MRRAGLLMAITLACNRAPTGGEVSLVPAEPGTADTLVAQLVEATDPDRDDLVEHDIYWYRDGEAQPALDGSRTVQSTATARGERWSVVVVPTDGIYDAPALEDHVEIVNSNPVIVQAELLPTRVYSGSVMSVSLAGRDADADDALQWSYRWTRNGAVAGSEPTFEAFGRGDEVRLTVSLSDGVGGSDTWTSPSIEVLNRSPSAPKIRLSPLPLSLERDVHCMIVEEAVDPDGDPLTYTFSWTVDDEPVLEAGTTVHPGDTLDAEHLAGTERVECSLLASDGYSGALSRTSAFTSGDHILIIWDVLELGTPSLVTALEEAGSDVVLSDTSETAYDGTNPSPAGFQTIIHLNGTTYNAPMPPAGQRALVDYVEEGGSFIHAEWNGYEAGNNPVLAELNVFDFEGVSEIAGIRFTTLGPHPLVDDLEPGFTVSAECGISASIPKDSTQIVASFQRGSGPLPGVGYRSIGYGRSIGFGLAGNFKPSCLADPALLRLYVNAARWER